MEENSLELLSQINNNEVPIESLQTGAFKQLYDTLFAQGIKVKYIDSPPLRGNEKGGCVDLYTAEEVSLKAGESAMVSLGVAMELPQGYDALIFPRSSTFKKGGILLTNSVGYVDNFYKGDDDVGMVHIYATRDVTIPKETRCFQFRLIECQKMLNFIPVDSLGNENRGGFGEGTKDFDSETGTND